MKDATGRRASNKWPWREPLLRISVAILARVRSNGCAIRFPDIMEMLVLSDDRTTPRRVPPSGNSFCRKIHKGTSIFDALGLACRFHACSPVSHSSYMGESRAAVDHTFLGTKSI